MLECKPWGTTELIHLDPKRQLSFIKVVAGGYSSRHLHRFKANVFTVVRGRMTITAYSSTRGLLEVVETFELTDGMTAAIGPGVVHRFYAHESTECFEMYYAPYGGEVSLDDISRFDQNGVDKKEDPDGQDERARA